MTTAILEHRNYKVTPEEEKVVINCKRCGDAIPKRQMASWKQYKKKKYCSECIKPGIRNLPLESEVGELPIGDFIGSKTQNGKLMANFYIGILEAAEGVDVNKKPTIDSLKNKVISTYKGIPISTDLVKAASDWLTINWIGRAGQRKAPDEKPKRTLAELQSRLRFLIKKLVKDKVVAEKIIVLLEGEGL